jgi:predicted amidohydrolase
MEKVKIACVQLKCREVKSFDDFYRHIQGLLEEAKGCEFVIFPELFTMELQYITAGNLLRVSEYTEQLVEFLKKAAMDREQCIVGTHVTAEGEKYYNTALIVTPDGSSLEHCKTHLFSVEKQLFSSGDRIDVVEVFGLKIGVAICYEVEFPEFVRILTLKGAEIVFCPSYTIGKHGYWRVRHCCQARAVENQIYIALSCLIGSPVSGLEGWGKSAIMSPCEPPWSENGVVMEAEENREEVIVAELDLELLRKKRETGIATTLKDRRPELYHGI